ncbi:MAG: tyrosine-type recombinase/integrase [Flavobacteriales bacterium]
METTKNKTSQYLTKIEINDWLNWLKKNDKWRYYLLVKLGISTLLRYSDLNRLCWNDLMDKKILFLNEKKTNKKREIRIERDIQETIKYVFNRLNDGYTDKLFPYHINSVNSYLKKSSFYSGVRKPHISTHSFRKSGGRYIWELNNKSDESLLMLSMLFNHTSTSITRRYLGIEREEIQNLYEFQSNIFLV